MQAWCRTDIDHFVAKALSENDLDPSAAADPNTLLRRLAFDLNGLPPGDHSAIGLERLTDDAGFGEVVESMVSSPAFGEHWSRSWLDVIRYADDQAHVVGNNQELSFTYRYSGRDFRLTDVHGRVVTDIIRA